MPAGGQTFTQWITPGMGLSRPKRVLQGSTELARPEGCPLTPPPGGPRDWSPPDVDSAPPAPEFRVTRPVRGPNHIVGLRWGRALAWTALTLGAASATVVLLVPLDGEPARPAAIFLFAGSAIWFGLMAEPRYRAVRGRGSFVAKTGIGLGVTAGLIAVYAFIVIVVGSYGTHLPSPASWLDPGGPTENVAGSIETPATSLAAEPLVGVLPAAAPTEAERLALGQSVGTAVYVLEHTAASDGTWPSSLAVTTDASSLITPAGLTLAPLPPGMQVAYSTSPDQRAFALTLLGPLGGVATYDSTTRTLSTTSAQ